MTAKRRGIAADLAAMDAAVRDDSKCPNGCGTLRWADDSWICPKCGDEWPDTDDDQ